MYLLHLQHGRVKVRSTAEQEEAKRKEREEKVKIYREITSKIYKKVELFVNFVLCTLVLKNEAVYVSLRPTFSVF